MTQDARYRLGVLSIGWGQSCPSPTKNGAVLGGQVCKEKYLCDGKGEQPREKRGIPHYICGMSITQPPRAGARSSRGARPRSSRLDRGVRACGLAPRVKGIIWPSPVQATRLARSPEVMGVAW